MFNVALINPKWPRNVGEAIRAASAYGADKLFMTGDRVPLVGKPGYRLPREERMRGRYVGVTPTERPFDESKGLTPIAVEVSDDYECLAWFEHPENALYVFGPEDGGLSSSELSQCHRFVTIPGLQCMNLATAIGNVLYDREAKRIRAGGIPLRMTPTPYTIEDSAYAL